VATSTLVETEKKVVWAKLEDFNPTSSKQIIEYLKFRKLPIPKHRTKRTDSVDAESLARLNGNLNDPVISGILELRKLEKATTYLSEKFVWSDGRMRPQYTTAPKTGRLSAKRPNIMTLPQPGRGSKIMDEASREIRKSFIPDPGYVLGEFDWKAIEALLTGWFANDPNYMEAAKIGVHDIFGSHLLYKAGLIDAPKSPFDPDIKNWIKWFKKEHEEIRARAKKRIYAGAYGQGAKNMARDLGVSIATVKELDVVFATMAPKVIDWQRETRLRAHKEGRLINPFQRSLSFGNVFNADGTLGRESSECLAFLPQSTCAVMLRKVLVALGTHPEEGTTFMLQIPEHDAIKFQVLESEVDRIMNLVKESMEKPWPELNGLVVEVEGKIGFNRSEMQTWKG